MYRERNGTVFQWKLRPGTVRHGTDFEPERNGTVRNGTNFDPERNGLERTGLRRKIKILTPIQKMSSSQSCSHRNSVQNGQIESSTALTATLFVKKSKFDHSPKKMSSSQSCSHRNSVQNAPVESSTALTATLFVKIPKFDHNPKKMCHHKVAHTEILCRMHRSRAPQLSWRP